VASRTKKNLLDDDTSQSSQFQRRFIINDIHHLTSIITITKITGKFHYHPTMKRSYKQLNGSDAATAAAAAPDAAAAAVNTSERFHPTIIEPEDDDCAACFANTNQPSAEPSTKRQRGSTTLACDCSSLNLLLKAIDEQQQQQQQQPIQVEQRKMVDRVPSMCFEIIAESSSSSSVSSTASVAKTSGSSSTRSSNDGPSPMPMKKLIALRRNQSMSMPMSMSMQRAAVVAQRPSVLTGKLPLPTMMTGLPRGAPLMPPPRLPTHLAPGQIFLSGRKIIPTSSN
jgi:hypothetical protein